MSGVLNYLCWQREDTPALWQLLLICKEYGGVLGFSTCFLATGACLIVSITCLIVSTTCLARFFRPLVRPLTRYYFAHIQSNICCKIFSKSQKTLMKNDTFVHRPPRHTPYKILLCTHNVGWGVQSNQ